MQPDIHDLEDFSRAFGHRFTNRALVLEALTHDSLLNEPGGNGRQGNSRLAHLGDAVVELAVRRALLLGDARADAGRLSARADLLVSDATLAGTARRLGLARFLRRGAGLKPDQDSDGVLAEVYEAAVGAAFLEGGFEQAARLVEAHLQLDVVQRPPA